MRRDSGFAGTSATSGRPTLASILAITFHPLHVYLSRKTGYKALSAAMTSGLVVIAVVFAMFLLFRDGDRIVAKIPDLLPFDRARSEALLLRIKDVIHGSVSGVVVIALIQGALCGGMFWALGIPSAALWGLVTVLTSVLPLART